MTITVTIRLTPSSLLARSCNSSRWKISSQSSGLRHLISRKAKDRTKSASFGSGKGKVLLIAAERPFREGVGIEFSRELHEIALRNIGRLPPHLDRRAPVRSVNGDAAEVELPKGNLVCYFNNPFGPPIISRVAERLVAHHRDHGCHILVVYVVPRHRDVFETSGIFRA